MKKMIALFLAAIALCSPHQSQAMTLPSLPDLSLTENSQIEPNHSFNLNDKATVSFSLPDSVAIKTSEILYFKDHHQDGVPLLLILASREENGSTFLMQILQNAPYNSSLMESLKGRESMKGQRVYFMNNGPWEIIVSKMSNTSGDENIPGGSVGEYTEIIVLSKDGGKFILDTFTPPGGKDLGAEFIESLHFSDL